MKQRTLRIIWTVICISMIIAMVLFAVAPGLQSTTNF